MATSKVVALCVASFFLGTIALVALAYFVLIKPNGKRFKKKREKQAADKKVGLLSRLGTMNLILIVVFASLLIFTVVMIGLFREYGTVPDTLVTCVFAALGGECGAMAWIKTAKERNKERKWELDDRKHYENAEKNSEQEGNNADWNDNC